MSTAIRYLRLYLHLPDGTRRAIGHLSQYGDILRCSFESDYILDPARPTLGLSFLGGNEHDTRSILASARDERLVRTDGRLPVFFQNLLPEGHNRERLARQRGCDESDEFELIAAAGHDLLGAVELEPVAAEEGIPEAVRLWHTTQGLDVLEPGFVESPVEDGAALAGVVPKFSAIKKNRHYVVRRSGEAGSYILKLPTSAHPELVQNEMAGYRMLTALGVHCARAQIISRHEAELPEAVEYEDILCVERFDRGPKRQRIHVEEFNQVLGLAPNKKYGKSLEQDFVAIVTVLDRLSARGQQDVEEFVLRFVAYVLMGNTDAHLKNWALVYPDGRHPQLAPAYDPVCVSAFFAAAPRPIYAVNRAIDARMGQLTWHDLDDLLRRAAILRVAPLLKRVRQSVRQAKADWPGILANAPDSVRAEVMARLGPGGVLLAQI